MALKLTEAQEQDVNTTSLREAVRLPAVTAAIRHEIARLARPPAPQRWMAWTGDGPLVAGDRIAWRTGGTVHHAAVAFPGDTGGMRASDTLLLRIAGPADGTALDDAGRIVEIHARALRDVRCARAAWSDEELRQLEAARQYSVPTVACRLACSEPVEGDRIAWTEAAGRTAEVRTIEAVVATRTETPDGHEIGLRVIRASGPGALEPAARSSGPQRRSPRAAASAPPGPTRPGASAYSMRQRPQRTGGGHRGDPCGAGPAGEGARGQRLCQRCGGGGARGERHRGSGVDLGGGPSANTRLRPAKVLPAAKEPKANWLKAMAEKLASEEGRASYKRRRQTVEPVFGVIKAVLGFAGFSLRGLDKVEGEWTLVALAYNCKRLHTLSLAT